MYKKIHKPVNPEQKLQETKGIPPIPQGLLDLADKKTPKATGSIIEHAASVNIDKNILDVVKGTVKEISGTSLVVEGVNTKKEQGTYHARVDGKTTFLPEGKKFSDIQVGDHVALSAGTVFTLSAEVLVLNIGIKPMTTN